MSPVMGTKPRVCRRGVDDENENENENEDDEDNRMTDQHPSADRTWTVGRARETSVDEVCLFCKQHTPETDRIELDSGSGEYLCRSCLGDLRTFKRTRDVHLWTTPPAVSSVQTAVTEQYEDRESALGRLHVEEERLRPLPSRVHGHDAADTE